MKLKRDERACPRCAEPIKKAASVCKHCGTEVAPVVKQQAQTTPGQTAIGCGVLLVLLLAISQCFGSPEKTPEQIAAESKKSEEDRRKGFHCLSAWDGSHRDFVDQVKSSLRDPESFEHVETQITPVSEKGLHVITMKYRAKNGFGGMNVETAIGTVQQSDCTVSLSLAGSS